MKTLRETLEARDLELQRVKEKNLDLAKKNEFLEKELNVEKDIVELKVEVSPCYIILFYGIRFFFNFQTT